MTAGGTGAAAHSTATGATAAATTTRLLPHVPGALGAVPHASGIGDVRLADWRFVALLMVDEVALLTLH